MPLTNPNKVVTEERLSEFYGQILPYMGGMPDVLANKFSKGDLYSTDEKMIGCWIDGKPLYQKCHYVLIEINATSTEILMPSVFPNIENIIKLNVLHRINSTASGETSIYKPAPTYTGAYELFGNYQISKQFAENITLRITTKENPSKTQSFMVICKYTKTTDSPIAIGDANDYSTDEKIVGTWIDGKPIYQKTVSTGGNVPSGATLILRTAMASTGYDTILYTKTS